ncbi:hypothetical protein DM992_00070 [Burkholderia sp. JP2-270]|nr:hypothetical protein DM992_00070 [Burkholderia sp. JP2-270]
MLRSDAAHGSFAQLERLRQCVDSKRCIMRVRPRLSFELRNFVFEQAAQIPLSSELSAILHRSLVIEVDLSRKRVNQPKGGLHARESVAPGDASLPQFGIVQIVLLESACSECHVSIPNHGRTHGFEIEVCVRENRVPQRTVQKLGFVCCQTLRINRQAETHCAQIDIGLRRFQKGVVIHNASGCAVGLNEPRQDVLKPQKVTFSGNEAVAFLE